MPVFVSLLRGVNLASHNRVKMDALRELYASLKLRDPQTYLQSGNVLFKTNERDPAALTRQIEKSIERKCGFRCNVIVRSTSELRETVKRNPFANRRNIDPRKFLVVFLARDPGEEARKLVRNLETAPEELSIHTREIYIYYTNGLARPKLPWMKLEKILNTPGTGRNWNTVTNLLALAEQLETTN